MTKLQPTKRSWTKPLLLVSLSLNLLIVGALVGALFTGGPKGGSARFDLTAGPLTRAMDPSRQDAVRDALRDSGAFRPSARRDIRADLQIMIETLRSETFDATAFRAVLSRQRDRLEAGQQAVVNAVVAQIEDMTMDERAAFAARLEDQLPHRGASGRPGRDADAPSGG